MKNLTVASIALLISTSAFAGSCPDFSGSFQLTNTTTAVNLTVTQKKCETVTFSYDYPSNGEVLGKAYPLDNQRRQTYEDATLIVYETSGIVGGELQNVVEDFYKATGETIKAVSHFEINASTDLVNESDYYNSSGQIYSTETNYFQRVKTTE